MMLRPCGQGLAGCRVAEQYWNAAPAPKLADTNVIIIIIIIFCIFTVGSKDPEGYKQKF